MIYGRYSLETERLRRSCCLAAVTGGVGYSVPMAYIRYVDHFAEYRAARRRVVLPGPLMDILRRRQDWIHRQNDVRAEGQEGTTIAKEVCHYAEMTGRLAPKAPSVSNRSTVRLAHAEDLASRLAAAVDYLELARDAAPLIKPVLLYYSCANLTGVLSRAFFEWEPDHLGHGMKVEHHADPTKTRVRIERNGYFPRLAITLFLLTGRPTPFIPVVAFAGEADESRQVVGDPVRDLSLAELMAFDVTERVDALLQHHGIAKWAHWKGPSYGETAFLLDVLLMYVASSYARYQPARWSMILAGSPGTGEMAASFGDAFERFDKFGFDRVLSLLGVDDWDFTASQHFYDNPYSLTWKMSRRR